LFGGDSGMSDEEYQTFCVSSVDALKALFDLMRNPLQRVAFSCQYETTLMKEFLSKMDLVDDIARRRLHKFIDQAKRGELSEEESNSYFAKLIERQLDNSSDITEEEMIEIAIMMMIAAVDTTAAKTSWNLVQLALNPDIQKQLYEELDRAVQREGGLTPRIIERSEVPLLSAFVRETHRCTPPIISDIMKEVSVPTEVHGVMLPEGTRIAWND
jgi:cytochrome P450 family 49 subfamily A